MTDAPALDDVIVDQRYEVVPLDRLLEHPENARIHDEALLDESIETNGFYGAIIVQDGSDRILAGHGRFRALVRRGAQTIPVIFIAVDDETADRILAVDNRANDLAGYDTDRYSTFLARMREQSNLVGTGFDDTTVSTFLESVVAGTPILPGAGGFGSFGDQAAPPTAVDAPPLVPEPGLADRFLIPPFSIFDARQGYWTERKRQWLSLGIQSEVGRPRNVLGFSEAAGLEGWAASGNPNKSVPGSPSGNDPQFYYEKRRAEKALGRELTTEEFMADHYVGSGSYKGHTSIFDPVLCEVIYRWFCPPKGVILDPFAGGSVRGVVAGKLGLAYRGVELRADQIAANEEQRDVICPADAIVDWVEGDARDVVPRLSKADAVGYDLAFSCPPYFDLEKYSDDPNDLSTMDWPDFCAAYRQIIAATVEALADNRFACFVIGEVRGPDGHYRGLVPETIAAFEAAGAAFYNDGILITAVGSLALRAARIFGPARKLAKAHQNVLVFIKGDPAKAVADCGDLILPDPAELFPDAIDLDALGETDEPDVDEAPES